MVGEHDGLMYYTLGQRQGLGIGGRQDAGDEPWFVAAKDLGSNTLIVVQGDHPLRYSISLQASQVSWINDEPRELVDGGTMRCAAKIRYRQPDQGCSVTVDGDGRLAVSFDEPQAAVAPGQFAVFYAGERCLGGAVIDSATSASEALLKTG